MVTKIPSLSYSMIYPILLISWMLNVVVWLRLRGLSTCETVILVVVKPLAPINALFPKLMVIRCVELDVSMMQLAVGSWVPLIKQSDVALM